MARNIVFLEITAEIEEQFCFGGMAGICYPQLLVSSLVGLRRGRTQRSGLAFYQRQFG